MKTLGLDIGTTTVSAVILDNGAVLDSVTLPNDTFLPVANSWERIQDPAAIRQIAMSAVERMLALHPDAAAIGITGQMHGIVYLDGAGEPVSPLYTWQDGRGELPYGEKESYAAHLSALTGYPMATGFGLVTHYYNLHNGLVPDAAQVFCTIHDYIAMLLAGRTAPLTDPSDAASFGLFDVRGGFFDEIAIQAAGMDCALLPQIAKEPVIGYYQGKYPVCVAIGDNQASFLGAAGGKTDTMLVNVGTGSQFSVFTSDFLECPGLETRPFPGGYLLVGSSLCGGRAYALLEKFLRETAAAVTGAETESCYGAMDALLQDPGVWQDTPVVVPLFRGTRQDPSLRASILALSPENFTAGHLAAGMLRGIVLELYDAYQRYYAAGGSRRRLVGSGNGLRKNAHMRTVVSDMFGMELEMSSCVEEAAAGAAMLAAMQ